MCNYRYYIVLVLMLFALLIINGNIFAQHSDSARVAAGLTIGQNKDDFKVGINATSPYFFDGVTAVRIRSEVAFFEDIHAQQSDWRPYLNASIGVIGASGVINDMMRLYGEGGTIVLFPTLFSDDISSAQVAFGGYGLFGFEFYTQSYAWYFIEIGGVGISDTADKTSNDAIYSNGLIVNAGVRFEL